MDVVGWLRLQWDRVGAWLCVGAGAIALTLGWIGVSGAPYSDQQIPYLISGGVGGVFLLGLGAMLWMSADLSDEWRKLDEISSSLQEIAGQSAGGISALAVGDDVGGPAAPTPGRLNRRVGGTRTQGADDSDFSGSR